MSSYIDQRETARRAEIEKVLDALVTDTDLQQLLTEFDGQINMNTIRAAAPEAETKNVPKRTP